MTFAFPPSLGSSSPWGMIEHRAPLGPAAFAVSTASRGDARRRDLARRALWAFRRDRAHWLGLREHPSTAGEPSHG